MCIKKLDLNSVLVLSLCSVVRLHGAGEYFELVFKLLVRQQDAQRIINKEEIIDYR